MTKIRSFLLALAVLAGTAGMTAAPALAADWGHRDARIHDWRGYGRPVFYAGVPYAYPPYAYPPYAYPYTAPAPAYVPPPVVYGAPALSLGIAIPFHR